MPFLCLIKIDLCGSKTFLENNSGEKGVSRDKLFESFTNAIREIFPHASNAYPEGTFYCQEGDAVYLVFDKVTVALRSTIEFMKFWYGNIDVYPDCRAVLDYGYFSVTGSSNIQILGEIFENISVIEKQFQKGQIGVTSDVTNKCDTTLVQYIRPILIDVTPKRKVETYLVNYENPRIIDHSYLAHALFIADPISDNVRERTIETLILELLASIENLDLEKISLCFAERSFPYPGNYEIGKIITNSQYIEEDETGCIIYKSGVKSRIEGLKVSFARSKEYAISTIAETFAEKIGIKKEIIDKKLSIEHLVEEYLCAVFLEIRMMANYFRSTGTLFERLRDSKDFDYVFFKFIRLVIPDRHEEMAYLKRIFLESIAKLANENNEYLASIFHNVLMLYYLNRNNELSKGQLSIIQDKKIYLDANTFYAYLCESSTYHDIIHFTINKLNSLQATVILLDRSLEEYNESLESAFYRYSTGQLHLYSNYTPWIWKEFSANPHRYKNDFRFCVAIHKMPKGKQYHAGDPPSSVEKELADIGITFDIIEPFLQKEQIKELYEEVYEAKKKFDPDTGQFRPRGTTERYHKLVLHDANCLNSLRDGASNPFSAKKLFVTCDYSLTKIRRRFPGKFEFLVTVKEFYDFMLPYLFIDNLMTKAPVQMPNFLLGSVIHSELYKETDFKEIVGYYLSTSIENRKEFKVLSDVILDKKFAYIKDKYKHLQDDSEQVDYEGFYDEATALYFKYDKAIRESIATTIANEEITTREQQLRDAALVIKKREDEISALKVELERFQSKVKKRGKYEKMMKNQKRK